MKTYDVEIKEIYKCVAAIQAESEEQAIRIAKTLYDAGTIELDSEDISKTEYSILC